jgi:hypothetical protein
LASSYTKRELREIILALDLIIGGAVVLSLIPFTSPTAEVFIITTPARLRTMSTTLIRLHASADRL